jgi:hypothetical protein
LARAQWLTEQGYWALLKGPLDSACPLNDAIERISGGKLDRGFGGILSPANSSRGVIVGAEQIIGTLSIDTRTFPVSYLPRPAVSRRAP